MATEKAGAVKSEEQLEADLVRKVAKAEAEKK